MRAAVLALPLLLGACQHAEPFVWVDDLPEPAHPDEYRIRAGDLLALRVWNQEALSPKVRVRQDGKITLPLGGDLAVAGVTPTIAAELVRSALKNFVNKPEVAVSVEESTPASISVLGEVAKPGVYPLASGAGVLQALASAGGLTEFAARDRIYVLRHHSPTVRIRFTYEALSRARGRAPDFQLDDGDILVAE